jgi:alpha-glucosidase
MPAEFASPAERHSSSGGNLMSETTWWKRGIIYQIYPRSFQDSNGDGIGDLKGIRQRLDYLAWLGVDAIWISPIYTSPMADFGYDVADYCGIDPIFGTLEDFDHLVEETHAKGLKLILDFVPNHTSDRHPWFQESRSSRTSSKRDWYIWRDPGLDDGPPNNWISNFGGPAWEWDEATGQYYYHAFLKEQPDLNWRNPEVRTAMYDALRFWLNRGVDGFRVDVIWHLIKDEQFRDNPPNLGYQPSQAEINRFLQVYSADQPEVHDVVSEMRGVLEEYPERVLIGEIYLPLERLVAYYGRDLAGAHLPFNFQLIQTAWNAREIAALINEYESALPEGGWPNWVLGNHDQTRIGARVGPRQARVAAMLLLTLRGTPTMYYGDEIGIGKVEIPPGAVQDPWAKNEPGLGLGRDPERTPMHWDGSAQGGFTSGTPWLPLDPTFAICHVERLQNDPASILMLYRRLIELRRQHLALSIGRYTPMKAEGDMLVYERQHGSERLLVTLNLGHQLHILSLPGGTTGRILLSSSVDRGEDAIGAQVTLGPDEGLIIALKE